ncbi:Aste57867_1623 [Aphanomyces stellatus]|uniref:Aste57867_1623 protein n=1 Tax=Aphanomyces stellatus TaxID=120398 RepID=A0A485KAT2_9STRA|nr:hypothetical protein As57867_001621 [Aphanomyces stellatus]VFT78836.1 Aste57867_1623 [Aphanomyces stellatus]
MGMPTTFSKIILVVLNTVFIAAGAFLIYLGTNLKGSNWSDVFSSATAVSVDSLGLYTIIFGSGVCLIALSGFFGALCHSRGLLTVYSVFLFISFAVFTLVAVVGFMSSSTASKWNDKDFPAAKEETSVASGFNEVYCYSQGARLCTSAKARDAFQAFVPASADLIITAAKALQIDVDAPTGVNGFCGSVDKQIAALGIAGTLAAKALPSEYKQACQTCATVQSQYGQYKTIFDWTEEKCALNKASALYCGKFLVSKSQGNDVYTGAPYATCRPAILDLWKSYSSKLAIGATVFAAVSLVLIFVSCEAGKRFNAYHDY